MSIQVRTSPLTLTPARRGSWAVQAWNTTRDEGFAATTRQHYCFTKALESRCSVAQSLGPRLAEELSYQRLSFYIATSL